jgi:hypothetical protein
VIHSTLDFHSDNLNGCPCQQQIEHPIHSFAHRRKFRLTRATDRDDQVAQEIFPLHAIVLSALRNEQAEFLRLRKTAHALDSIKIFAERLLKFCGKRSLIERPIGIEATPEPWQVRFSHLRRCGTYRKFDNS